MKRLFPCLTFLALLAASCGLFRAASVKPVRGGESDRLEIGVNLQAGEGADLVRFRQAGGTWVRINLAWADLEPRQGQFHFSDADAALDRCRDAGLRVFATLSNTPPWASPDGKATGVPKTEDWKRFVTAAVEHTKDRVEVYGIWNEPNLEEFWGGSVKQYVEVLLKPAYAAIKQADPGARVAGPELAHLYSARLGIQSFFKAFKKLDGDKYIDIFTHHVYGKDDFQPKITGFGKGPVIYKNGLVQMLQKTGLWGKKAWITEIGQSASDGGDEAQARVLVGQLNALVQETWVRKAFIYKLRDTDSSDQYGLIRVDGSARPAFGELAKWISGMGAGK